MSGAWAQPEMADSDPGERNYDNMLKMLSDLNKDLEKLLEVMEKISVPPQSPAPHAETGGVLELQHLSPDWTCLVVAVQATWMAYDMVVMRTNPTLAESMHRLEDAFLNCKEEMEKNWQELLTETKHKQ
ncbi:synaptonemal complex central element protein 3 isoform X1 [Nannospalax galili]|uniref:synaptonemal complex central element protein 3 isoform X1 n=1 Tax=Nannospalax galili TaxID=1026970 RepID=UPI00111BD9D3|nr:synaptonemal complex central element protein 3 isoform X1 [Nannospalax galili]